MEPVDDTVRELYGVDPTGFVAARDQVSADLRARGDGERAEAVKQLRRPTVAAWVVNLLVRTEIESVEILLDVGERLRAAQRNLRGAEIRDLDRERVRMQAALTGRAGELIAGSGRAWSEQIRQQVEQTLHAAVSDPESARQVRAGLLVKPLEYGGFGLDELSVAAVRNWTSQRSQTVEPSDTAQRTKTSRSAPEDKGSRASRGEAKRSPAGRRAKRGAAAGSQDRDPEPDDVGSPQDDEAAKRPRRVELADASDRALDDLRHAESEQKQAERSKARLREELETVQRSLREATRSATRAHRRVDAARSRYEASEQRRSEFEGRRD